MARPKAALVVTKVDRQVLDSMAHRARTAPGTQLARRARIVLACAAGLDNTTSTPPTRWGQPYVWTKTADDILASIARFALRTVTVYDRQQVMSRTTGTGH